MLLTFMAPRSCPLGNGKKKEGMSSTIAYLVRSQSVTAARTRTLQLKGSLVVGMSGFSGCADGGAFT